MDNQHPQHPDYSVLLQVGTGIIVSVTAGAVLWLWQSANANSERLARIEERLTILTTDRYTATDALKDNRLVDSRIESVERRLQVVEKQTLR